MNEAIRILHVIGAMDRGGAETMIMNLYRKIDREKIQFDFIVHTNKKCAYDDEIRSLGGHIYHVPKFNGRNFITYITIWNNFFDQHTEHSIVHGHIGSSAALYLSVAKKYGKVAIAHSHNTKSTVKSLKSILWRLYSFPTRYIADHFFGCGQKAGEDRFGKKIANSNKFQVLNNAIDTSLFSYSELSRQAIRQEFHIQDKFVVGHVGRFSEQKNHDFLIDIFKCIYDKCPQAVLLLVGDGELRQSIQRKVDKLGLSKAVIFAGVREDIPAIMFAMDVFVFPSLYEGLGIVSVEAQAAGLHTICADSIPSEARLTDLFHPLSLSDCAEIWAEKVLEYANGYERRNMYEEICSEGYDIGQTSGFLEKYYLHIAEK